MESERNNGLICTICKKEFYSTSSRNRHMKKFHLDLIGEKQLKKRIICPMCKEKLSNNAILINHLNNIHHLTITKSVLNFRNFEEFTTWRAQGNRKINYACHRKTKLPTGEEQIDYICNRSDVRGFTSTCKQRSMKSGGSIRIQGMCPSRIVAKTITNGSVIVQYVETHVGHTDELKTKRCKSVVDSLSSSSSEENVLIIDKSFTSQDGVSNFIHENTPQQKLYNFEETRKRTLEEFCDYARSLDENSFFQFMAKINKTKNEEQEELICKKRKMEKQTFK